MKRIMVIFLTMFMFGWTSLSYAVGTVTSTIVNAGPATDTAKTKTIIFAFPGNPVSTFVGCLKYFYPWFKKSMGIDCKNQHKAILAEDFVFKPELTYFLQVITENKNGMLYATPVVGNGSGDLANLAETDAFIELPDHRNEFKEGEVFPLIEFR